MKRPLTVLASLLLVTACSGPPPRDTAAPAGPSKVYTMDQLLKNVSISGGSSNPDESKLLVTSNETGVFNVYEIDLATGQRSPVTEGTETTFALAHFPADGRILFTRDNAGNEIYHIFLREEDGTVRDLTGGAKTRESFTGFAHDVTSFYTVNNSRTTRYMDLYEWDVQKLEPRMIYRNDTGLDPAMVSPDRRWLVLSKANTTNDSDLYVADLVSGGQPVLISKHEGEATFSPQDISVDSRYLYYTTNSGGEFAELKRYDLTTGQHEPVFATNWDVTFAYFSHNGTYRVIGTNEDGTTVVRITRIDTGKEITLPELPPDTVSGVGFSRSERLMRFYVSSDTMPRDLFVFDLETKELTQLTLNLNPEVDPDDLVKSTSVRFKARDDLEVPGFLYKPLNASPEHRVPALVWVHGGSGGQSRPGFSAEKQFLINHGYAIFAVNNRGSSGYGKSFLAADDRRHGREPLWDCVDARTYLESLDWVDPQRIAIIGGSYGGYMVLAALTFEPQAFEAGVDIFGVANWVCTLENIPPWWESFRQALYHEIGDPEKDAKMLHDTSPVFFADRIVQPLLILQGANDPRVLKAESDDMVKAVRANGGTVEYVVFDDEGHGFTKNANRIKGFDAVLDFLDTHLKAPRREG